MTPLMPPLHTSYSRMWCAGTVLLSKAREGAEPGVKPRALVLFVGGDTLGALSQLLQGVSSVRPLALDLLWQVHFVASRRSSHTTSVLLCTCCGNVFVTSQQKLVCYTCQEHASFKCQVLHVSRQQEQLANRTFVVSAHVQLHKPVCGCFACYVTLPSGCRLQRNFRKQPQKPMCISIADSGARAADQRVLWVKEQVAAGAHGHLRHAGEGEPALVLTGCFPW